MNAKAQNDRFSASNVPNKGYTGATPDVKMGGAFGGGGCYSAVSQLGFLRGLLADDMGNGSASLAIDSMGTTSGGSWSLAMFFNNMPNGIDDLYWRGNYVDTSENPVWQCFLTICQMA